MYALAANSQRNKNQHLLSYRLKLVSAASTLFAGAAFSHLHFKIHCDI